jgi:hypothetical protein
MSLGWWFHAYSPRGFEALFGSGSEESLATLRELLLSDFAGFDPKDRPTVERLTQWLVQRGLTYEGLSATETRLLDAMVLVVFCPEGPEFLERRSLSPDLLHPAVLEQAARRAGASFRQALAPLLEEGRRHGTSGPAAGCRYALLSPAECDTIARETRHLLDAGVRWPEDGFPDVLQECLVQPLADEGREGGPVIALLS